MQYDAKTDAVYIELSKGTYKSTRKITDSIMVDQDNKGKVLGIEILDAKENISAFDPKKTKFTLQAS